MKRLLPNSCSHFFFSLSACRAQYIRIHHRLLLMFLFRLFFFFNKQTNKQINYIAILQARSSSTLRALKVCRKTIVNCNTHNFISYTNTDSLAYCRDVGAGIIKFNMTTYLCYFFNFLSHSHRHSNTRTHTRTALATFVHQWKWMKKNLIETENDDKRIKINENPHNSDKKEKTSAIHTRRHTHKNPNDFGAKSC